jgi:flagellar hook-basal body complex protein FliE
MGVSGLQAVQQGLLQNKSLQKEQTEGTSFRELLMQALNNVDQLEKESDAITNDFIAGKTDSIHSVLIAAEKASLSLDMVIEVRNRVLDAYNEIMRMQV